MKRFDKKTKMPRISLTLFSAASQSIKFPDTETVYYSDGVPALSGYYTR